MTHTTETVIASVNPTPPFTRTDAYLVGYLSSRLASILNIVSDESKTDAEKVALLKIIALP